MTQDGGERQARLAAALWRIYKRSEQPEPWSLEGNLPWNEPEFSERMLREHLDQAHSAASRTDRERRLQIEWFWQQLKLAAGQQLLDVTCGPGLYATALARQGVHVMGIDFSPASIAHAHRLAEQEGGTALCHFIEADVRQADFGENKFEAALFLYGQLAVFPREVAQQLLEKIADALKPGGRLVVELLEQERVDKNNSNWWYTDDKGLWGETPFFSFGERFWNEEERLSCERYYTLHLESGKLDEIVLCDQTYAVLEMKEMMRAAGFARVTVFPAWDGLELYDKTEWNVYLAEK